MSDTPKVVVEKSTVPVRTAEAVRRVLATNDKGVKFQVRKKIQGEERAQQISVSGAFDGSEVGVDS